MQMVSAKWVTKKMRWKKKNRAATNALVKFLPISMPSVTRRKRKPKVLQLVLRLSRRSRCLQVSSPSLQSAAKIKLTWWRFQSISNKQAGLLLQIQPCLSDSCLVAQCRSSSAECSFVPSVVQHSGLSKNAASNSTILKSGTVQKNQITAVWLISALKLHRKNSSDRASSPSWLQFLSDLS